VTIITSDTPDCSALASHVSQYVKYHAAENVQLPHHNFFQHIVALARSRGTAAPSKVPLREDD
jgi:hypothetical protein